MVAKFGRFSVVENPRLSCGHYESFRVFSRVYCTFAFKSQFYYRYRLRAEYSGVLAIPEIAEVKDVEYAEYFGSPAGPELTGVLQTSVDPRHSSPTSFIHLQRAQTHAAIETTRQTI